MFHFKRDSIGALEATEKKFPILASYGWPINTVILYQTNLIKHVLTDKEKKYVKGRQTDEMKIVMGEGLVTNNDRASWLRNRVIVSKELGGKAILDFSFIINDFAKKMIEKWRPGLELDFSTEMRNVTFLIAGKTLLGSELSLKDAKIVDEAVLFTSEMAHDHMFSLLPIPYWVPTPNNLKFQKHNKNLSRIVERLIQIEKDGSNANDGSILQRLVHAKNPQTGESLSPLELKDEVITLLIAGYETTSNSLVWILGLLAFHIEKQEKLRKELSSVNSSITSIQFKDSHPYLYCCILEGIRLYTAIPMSSRRNLSEDRIGEYKIPKDTSLVIPVWNIHRSELYWENALEFTPERFIGVDANRLDYFLPFSKGERRCVGEHFSLVEIAIVVNQIISSFKLELVKKELPKAVSHFSLKPEGGMHISLKSIDEE